jgi:hypothetical protein
VALPMGWTPLQNGLAEPLGPEEDPEDAEIKLPKVYKQRIKLGRLRRAMAKRDDVEIKSKKPIF